MFYFNQISMLTNKRLKNCIFTFSAKRITQFFYMLILMIFSQTVFAGGGYYSYYSTQIDLYDPSTGLYFNTVERTKENRGFLGSTSSSSETININVFDPATEKSRLLFKEPINGVIAAIVFEVGFKDGSVEFSTENCKSVKNNKSVAPRDPKSKILVAVRNDEKKEVSLLAVDKQKIGDPVRIATISSDDDWHIDVKNSKLRVIHQTGQDLEIKSYDW